MSVIRSFHSTTCKEPRECLKKHRHTFHQFTLVNMDLFNANEQKVYSYGQGKRIMKLYYMPLILMFRIDPACAAYQGSAAYAFKP